MYIREIRRYIRHIAEYWSTRRLTIKQVLKAQLSIKASAKNHTTGTTPRRLPLLHCMPTALYIMPAS